MFFFRPFFLLSNLLFLLFGCSETDFAKNSADLNTEQHVESSNAEGNNSNINIDDENHIIDNTLEGVDGLEELIPPAPALFPVPTPAPVRDSHKTGNPDDDSGSCQTADSDGDGACNENDRCPGFDDNIDSDGDGDPDECDCDPEDPTIFEGQFCETLEPAPACQVGICQQGECVLANRDDYSPCGSSDLKGPCDRPDYCLDGECVDLKKQAGFPCDTSTGRLGQRTCNPIDTCDGVSDECPQILAIDGAACDLPDVVSRFPCVQASEGECQSGSCIPVPEEVGTVCRESAGDCDVAETCDGETFLCPDDDLAPENTPCGINGLCNGEGECFEDLLAQSEETLIKEGEYCTAGSPCVIANIAGPCQIGGVCNFEGTCEVIHTPNVLCRPAEGPCDSPEYCLAECPEEDPQCDLTVCPDNEKRPQGTLCEYGSTCQQDSYCDGESSSCPEGENFDGITNISCLTSNLPYDECNGLEGHEYCYEGNSYCYPTLNPSCTRGENILLPPPETQNNDSVTGDELGSNLYKSTNSSMDRIGTSNATYGSWTATGAPGTPEQSLGYVLVSQYESDNSATIIPESTQVIHSPSDTQIDKNFGTAVSLWENILVVGSIATSHTHGVEGIIYVYKYINNAWELTSQISGTALAIKFLGNYLGELPSSIGKAISISESKLVIGLANVDLFENPVSSGVAYATNNQDGIFSVLQFDAYTETNTQGLGASVSVAQDGWFTAGNPDKNEVLVFDETGTLVETITPNQFPIHINPSNEVIGPSVSINNQFLAFGAPYAKSYGTLLSKGGSAYLMLRDDLSSLRQFTSPLGHQDIIFGSSVALDRNANGNNTLVVSDSGFNDQRDIYNPVFNAGAMAVYAPDCQEELNCNPTPQDFNTKNATAGSDIPELPAGNLGVDFGAGDILYNTLGSVHFNELAVGPTGVDAHSNRIVVGAPNNPFGPADFDGTAVYFFFPN